MHFYMEMPFKSGNPGRPSGARVKITMRYLEEVQAGCPPDTYRKIAEKQARDALSDNWRVSQPAARWLAKQLTPPDPAHFIQMFAPEMPLSEIEDSMKRYAVVREQALELIKLIQIAQSAPPDNSSLPVQDVEAEPS